MNVSKSPNLPKVPLPLSTIVSPKNLAILKKRHVSQAASVLEVKGQLKPMESLEDWKHE